MPFFCTELMYWNAVCQAQRIEVIGGEQRYCLESILWCWQSSRLKMSRASWQGWRPKETCGITVFTSRQDSACCPGVWYS